MEETCSKLNSTQKIVVNLLQQLVTECTDRVPATQPLYSLHAPPPLPTGYRVIRPSPLNSVDSGAGRQQVSTNMASSDRLQSLQITRPVYRLYSLIFTKTDHFNHWLQSLPTRYRLYSLASPKPVTESTHLVHSTLQVDVEAFTRITSTDWLRSVPTRCRATQSLF